MRRETGLQAIYSACEIDPWFLDQMMIIIEERIALEGKAPSALSARQWKRVKQLGFSDAQIAYLTDCSESDVRVARLSQGIRATFKTVDTCAAEFDAVTPYHYSTYEDEDEIRAGTKPRMMILGSGPNRIGQGLSLIHI